MPLDPYDIYRNLQGNNMTTQQFGLPQTSPYPYTSYTGFGHPSHGQVQRQVATTSPTIVAPNAGPASLSHQSRPINERRSTSPDDPIFNPIGSVARGAKRVLKKSYQAWFKANPHLQSQSAADTNNTGLFLAEVQRATQVDMSSVAAQFRDLNRDIQSLCDRLGRYASTRKQLPAVPAGDDLDLKAHFTSAEDFIFYGALAILSSNIFKYLLLPFHPIMDIESNHRIMTDYESLSTSGMSRNIFLIMDLRCASPVVGIFHVLDQNYSETSQTGVPPNSPPSKRHSPNSKNKPSSNKRTTISPQESKAGSSSYPATVPSRPSGCSSCRAFSLESMIGMSS